METLGKELIISGFALMAVAQMTAPIIAFRQVSRAVCVRSRFLVICSWRCVALAIIGNSLRRGAGVFWP